jgi:hypothetical protein
MAFDCPYPCSSLPF